MARKLKNKLQKKVKPKKTKPENKTFYKSFKEALFEMGSAIIFPFKYLLNINFKIIKEDFINYLIIIAIILATYIVPQFILIYIIPIYKTLLGLLFIILIMVLFRIELSKKIMPFNYDISEVISRAFVAGICITELIILMQYIIIMKGV